MSWISTARPSPINSAPERTVRPAKSKLVSSEVFCSCRVHLVVCTLDLPGGEQAGGRLSMIDERERYRRIRAEKMLLAPIGLLLPFGRRWSPRFAQLIRRRSGRNRRPASPREHDDKCQLHATSCNKRRALGEQERTTRFFIAFRYALFLIRLCNNGCSFWRGSFFVYLL